MKKYELIQLNKELTLSRNKELTDAQDAINAKAAEGWELLQIISPSDLGGVMYGLFVKEETGNLNDEAVDDAAGGFDVKNISKDANAVGVNY